MSRAQLDHVGTLPQAGQSIQHDGNEYTTIKEGLAHILVPHGTPTLTDPRMSKEDVQKQQVFYNPIQQFNRDLSVLAIKTFGQDLVVRKEEKHKLQQQKAERKKKRQQTSEKSESEHIVSGSNGGPAKKRKIEDGDAVATEQELLNNNHGVLKSETEENAVSGANSQDHERREPRKPSFTILDALSATGLRALRYAKEIPFATSVTANDMSEKATKAIALNVHHNNLQGKVQSHTGNAIAYMYSFCDKKGYDVIDLDPYGTASPFIDSAIQAINDEGLLCVTCTDSAIFASHGYLEKTYSSYGGIPFIGDACHEGGLRLILHTIASSAAKYGMAIEPLLSLSIDYYIRVFVRVRKSPHDVKLLAGKTMLVYHCDSGCGSWTTQFLARNKVQPTKNGSTFMKHSFSHGPSADQQCEHCGFKTHLSGPMYGGPLHNAEFVKRMLAQLKEVDRETYPTMDRIEGMLHTALEEITFGMEGDMENKESERLDPLIPKADPAEVDRHPFFFIPSTVSKVLHCSAPPTAAIRGALRHAGFRVTMSHCKPGSIKTDASWRQIWHVMLEYVRQKAKLKNPLRKTTAGYAIVSKSSDPEAKFMGGREDYLRGKSSTAAHISSTLQTLPVQTPVMSSNSNQTHPEQNSSTEGMTELNKPPSYLDVTFPVEFDENLGKDRDRGKYVRYQLAPRENWGPMSRAK